MTSDVTKPRKRKKGLCKEKLPASPRPYEHDHTDGRWYSDCPACNPELAEATR